MGGFHGLGRRDVGQADELQRLGDLQNRNGSGACDIGSGGGSCIDV